MLTFLLEWRLVLTEVTWPITATPENISRESGMQDLMKNAVYYLPSKH